LLKQGIRLFKNIRSRITAKMTAGYILIVVMSILLAAILFITSFSIRTFGDRRNEMLSRAREIAKAAGPFLSQRGNAEINRDEYDNMWDILDLSLDVIVLIFNSDRKPVLSSRLGGKQGKNMRIPWNVPDYLKDLPEPLSAFFNDIYEGNEVLREFRPVYPYTLPGSENDMLLMAGVPSLDSDNRINGAVIVILPVKDITGAIDRVFILLLAAMFIAIIFTGILSKYFSSSITRPLRLMNRSAVEMTQGNYSVRTDIIQDDEIGQLASSLDLLSAKIEYTVDQLFQEKDKLHHLFESITEGIMAFDTKFSLINYNNAVISLLKKTQNKDIKSDMEEILDKYEIKNLLENAVSTGRKTSSIIDFEDRKLGMEISPLKNSTGNIIGTVLLMRDVSESERLEQMRRDFIANISHELRTPLTLVKGYVEALKDGVFGDKDAKNCYKKILNETRGLERLVNDLTEISRLQTGRITLELGMINIEEVINGVAKNMQLLAKNKNININIKSVNGIPPVIGDYDRLRQLFIIFMDNALKFSPSGSCISISVYVRNFVYITLSDEGDGISEKDMPYVWERFYKGDKSRTGHNTGSGLGLSIARHLIELHDGTVNIESTEGKGTTVIIGLPYKRRRSNEDNQEVIQ